MPLADIERSFVGNLLRPQGNEPDFLKKLLPLHSLSEEKQLSIYRSNVNGAHQKVLGQIYPACLNILGDDYFNQLCRVYRVQYPSIDPDLNVYGESFWLFLQEQTKLHAELSDYDYLAELALIEWHWHASYYAKNDTVFDFAKLALVGSDDQDKLCFTLSYSLFLHSTCFPLLEIWQANKNKGDDQQEFIIPDAENYFCLSRFNLQPEIERLTQYHFDLLNSIANGLPLTALAEINNDSDETDDFQSQLIHFIEKGWVSGFAVCSEKK